jgi:tricorn protease
LIFVSDRDFNPIYGRTEFNHVYQDMARIYLITLSKSVESPFKPQSDEVSVSEEKPEPPKDVKESTDAKAQKPVQEKKQVNVVIDLDGIKDRIVGLPITPSNYTRIGYADGKVYYIRRGLKDEKPMLYMYDLKEKKETELGQFNNFIISFDGKKMLVVREKTYAIIDLPKAKIDLKETLNLAGLEVNLDRKAEWKQIFDECWRQMREFFYDPNLHGVDWAEVKKKYEVLLPYVNHRADLTYIIGEMIGELNAGHTYVGGGDLPKIEKTQVGLLGAELERDKKSGYYRIKKILKGENWDKNLRSPLTELGVNVKEGDYILAVNGKSVKEVNNIYELLVNTVGKQVKLRVNSQPKEEGSREVTVVPIGDETRLYYYNWVQNNIEKVNKATNGQVGYIHIPDMGVMGLNEFVKHFYPQLNKKALIIDVRGNGGGNVSPMIIERLRREIAMVSISRYTIPTPNPRDMHLGPKICIIDEFSASDGDIFPYRFKKYGLGKLVGKRTWGGVIGIRGTLPLVDGGYLNKPEFAVYGAEGEGWIIEGYGVEPDVYVDNDPAKEYAGIDEQLNKAIELILEELKTKEKKLPPVPPYPKK